MQDTIKNTNTLRLVAEDDWKAVAESIRKFRIRNLINSNCFGLSIV
jgi:hypothetical protein